MGHDTTASSTHHPRVVSQQLRAELSCTPDKFLRRIVGNLSTIATSFVEFSRERLSQRAGRAKSAINQNILDVGNVFTLDGDGAGVAQQREPRACQWCLHCLRLQWSTYTQSIPPWKQSQIQKHHLILRASKVALTEGSECIAFLLVDLCCLCHPTGSGTTLGSGGNGHAFSASASTSERISTNIESRGKPFCAFVRGAALDIIPLEYVHEPK